MSRERFPGVVEQMQRMLYRAADHHCRITKWRLTYSEMKALAIEIEGEDEGINWRPQRGATSMLMALLTGNQTVLGIPVEVRDLQPGMAYPIPAPDAKWPVPAFWREEAVQISPTSTWWFRWCK